MSVLATKGKQRADAEVEAIGDGEADQQDAEKQPPDQAQDFVVYQFVQDHDGYSARGNEGFGNKLVPPARRPAPAFLPFWMALIISVISTMISVV